MTNFNFYIFQNQQTRLEKQRPNQKPLEQALTATGRLQARTRHIKVVLSTKRASTASNLTRLSASKVISDQEVLALTDGAVDVAVDGISEGTDGGTADGTAVEQLRCETCL